METTRHYTTTVYVVSDGAVALHEHDGLGKWLPPGGHVDRDELPHEAGLREVREETGLDADLVAERDDVGSATVDALPKPQHFQLADVNVHDDFVGHQHVDLVYYARADTREIDPADGEQPADAWRWFSADDLEATDALDPDVAEIGKRAIETVRE
ncbi:NUDIX domain-containing protein [Halosimplex litoreum]|uniref:NUDIX domain-containing protein n=1 Tax=Halosimplex litoreum TaxID=1198301 RepID=A0A7T3KW03_9EURY|nr:NUDIX domain-containing protein [Halosimplex litoreum]QPV63538.1 NUDIX domain-containing protein [Halosimplex litoreum]